MRVRERVCMCKRVFVMYNVQLLEMAKSEVCIIAQEGGRKLHWCVHWLRLTSSAIFVYHLGSHFSISDLRNSFMITATDRLWIRNKEKDTGHGTVYKVCIHGYSYIASQYMYVLYTSAGTPMWFNHDNTQTVWVGEYEKTAFDWFPAHVQRTDVG